MWSVEIFYACRVLDVIETDEFGICLKVTANGVMDEDGFYHSLPTTEIVDIFSGKVKR